jgi:hypothetical protein
MPNGRIGDFAPLISHRAKRKSVVMPRTTGAMTEGDSHPASGAWLHKEKLEFSPHSRLDGLLEGKVEQYQTYHAKECAEPVYVAAQSCTNGGWNACETNPEVDGIFDGATYELSFECVKQEWIERTGGTISIVD